MGTKMPTVILNPSEATKEIFNYIENPDDVASGDRGIPPTVQAVEGQNSSSATIFLLENQIADSSAATSAATVNNTGVTLDGSNNLVFDGEVAADYLQMDASIFTSTFALLQEWKFDLWVYPNTTRTQSVLFGGATLASGTLGLRIESGTKLTTYQSDWIAGNTELAAAGSIVNNTWHFITIEKWLDGAQWKVDTYVNGVLKTSKSVADFALYAAVDFYVGHDETDRGFVGSVNKVRVNNKAEHFGVNFTPSARETAYTTDTISLAISTTTNTTRTLTDKRSGRDSSNAPIEITEKNANKAIVADFGNVSGSISPDFTSAEELTMATTAAVTDLGGMTGLGVNEAGILTIDNSAGEAIDTNGVSILTASNTGTYNKAFVNRAGTYYYIDAGGEEKEI